MKYLRRIFILCMLLLLMPTAFGEIQITLPGKDIYNLGEKISSGISIKEDDSNEGFFKLHILCGSYSLQYYTTPLNLEAGSRTQVTVPDLPLSKPLIGECTLKSDFESADGTAIDTGQSRSFLVTDKINITADENMEAKPGEKIILLAGVQKNSNELLSKGEAEITFKDKTDRVNVSAGKFQYVIDLTGDTETGDFPVHIVATDKYSNYGDKTLNLRILPIPTRIENSFDSNILMPGDTLRVRIALYDHLSRTMNGTRIDVRAFDSSEKLIAEKDVQTLGYFELKTEKSQLPGIYLLLSKFEDIKEQSSFTVETVKRIAMKQEGNSIYIENIGNIKYDEEVTVILEKDDKKYLINKKVKLEPGEKAMIDLSKEVPYGNYNIALPKNAVNTNKIISNNESGNASNFAENVLKSIPIDDNRPLLKKTVDGVFAITGAVIFAAGYVASRPALATTIIVLIILGTVLHYSWGFIKSKVTRRRNNESHLFKDFNYDSDKKFK